MMSWTFDKATGCYYRNCDSHIEIRRPDGGVDVFYCSSMPVSLKIDNERVAWLSGDGVWTVAEREGTHMRKIDAEEVELITGHRNLLFSLVFWSQVLQLY